MKIKKIFETTTQFLIKNITSSWVAPVLRELWKHLDKFHIHNQIAWKRKPPLRDFRAFPSTWNPQKNQQIQLPLKEKTCTRWFKVTFLCPSWRSLNSLKGSLNHPKKVTNWITRYEFPNVFQAALFLHLSSRRNDSSQGVPGRKRRNRGVWKVLHLCSYLEPQGQPFPNDCFNIDDERNLYIEKWLEITISNHSKTGWLWRFRLLFPPNWKQPSIWNWGCLEF